MSNLSKKYKQLLVDYERLKDLFDSLSTYISIRKLHLNRLISTTQAKSSNIESRSTTLIKKYIRLLDYLEEYKGEEELRSMLDIDHSILSNYYMNTKQKIDDITTKESLKESKDETVKSLKDYKDI